MQIVTLTPEHLLSVPLQTAQGWAGAFMTPDMAREIVASAAVGAAAVLDGRTIACAGLVELHPARAQAWAMFSTEALARFKTIHRVIRVALNAARWRRVEMYVDCQHRAAQVWAHRLGFACEGRLRAVTPDGRDCYLYARIKEA